MEEVTCILYYCSLQQRESSDFGKLPNPFFPGSLVISEAIFLVLLFIYFSLHFLLFSHFLFHERLFKFVSICKIHKHKYKIMNILKFTDSFKFYEHFKHSRIFFDSLNVCKFLFKLDEQFLNSLFRKIIIWRFIWKR